MSAAPGRLEATPPMQTYSGVVYPWHCDHVGHMNVMHYMGKFDEATWFFFNRIGLSREFLNAHHRGMAAVEQRIAYQRELRPGDVLMIRTTVTEVRAKVLQFVHRMIVPDTDATAALMLQTTVYLDLGSRKSVPLPEPVREHARTLVGPVDLPWNSVRDREQAR
jgi:acyl-CoA thioester hydrolase